MSNQILPLPPGSVTVTCTQHGIPHQYPTNETSMTDSKGMKASNLLLALLQTPPPPSDLLCN